MEDDIKSKVAIDFVEADREEALGLLNLLATVSPRVLRCVVYLARGDLSQLVYYSDRAMSDWRDVLYWAEYDKNDQKVRDFNKPFD